MLVHSYCPIRTKTWWPGISDGGLAKGALHYGAARLCKACHDDPAWPLLALAEKPFRKRAVTHPKHLASVNIKQLETMCGNIDMLDGKHTAELIIHRLAKLAQVAVSALVGILHAVQLDAREPALQGLVENGPLQRQLMETLGMLI